MGIDYSAKLAYGYNTEGDNKHDADLAKAIYSYKEEGIDWAELVEGVPEPDSDTFWAACKGVDIDALTVFGDGCYIVSIYEPSLFKWSLRTRAAEIDPLFFERKPEWDERFQKIAAFFNDKFEEPPRWYLGVYVG